MRHIARVIERTVPGIPHVINLPRKLASEQSLIAAAKAALDDVKPYSELFIEKGLPADFETQLAGAISAVEAGKHAEVTATARRVNARMAIRTALQRGRDIVHCLDAVVRRCCKADTVDGAAILTEWESARRVHKTAGSGTAAPVIPAINPIPSAA